MKTKLLIAIVAMSNVLFGQITIKEDVQEKAVVKPAQYDSLYEFKIQSRPIDYKQYIGQQLFFIPYSKKYEFESEEWKQIKYLESKVATKAVRDSSDFLPFEETSIYKGKYTRLLNDKHYNKRKDPLGLMAEMKQARIDHDNKKAHLTKTYKPYFTVPFAKAIGNSGIYNTATKLSAVEGKYFTILDIEATDRSNFDIVDNMPSYSYVDLENVDFNTDYLTLRIKLLNDETNDTLYWFKKSFGKYENLKGSSLFDDPELFKRVYPFILVSYFTKAKKDYENQQVIMYETFNSLVDIETGEIGNIEEGEILTCTEVTFIDSEDQPHLIPYYILQNENGNQYKLPLGSRRSDKETFITLKEHERRKKLFEMKEEERLKLAKEQELANKKAFEKFQAECISKYGATNGKLISEGKVKIGMTREMCLIAWGEPLKNNRTTVEGLVHEQWVYSWDNYLYFQNGKLTAIQD